MNHTITQHRGGNAPADAHSGEGSYDLKPIYPAMLRVMELVGRPRINPADENYVPSGFEGYDKRTNGFARGTLTVISGWTLADSRNLQLDIVRHAAVSGLPSAIFCPRLSGYEVAVRIMSAETDMPMKALLSDDSLDEDERGLCDAFCSLCEHMPLYVNSERSITLDSIMDACRRLKRTVDLKLIALHRIDAIANNSGCELGKALDRLASFANEIDTAIIVTSAMEQGRARIDGRRPLLLHLKNSETVFQYADTVLIAHRPGLYDEKTDPNETELILAKHPWLSPCTFNLRLKPEYSKFTDQ